MCSLDRMQFHHLLFRTLSRTLLNTLICIRLSLVLKVWNCIERSYRAGVQFAILRETRLQQFSNCVSFDLISAK